MSLVMSSMENLPSTNSTFSGAMRTSPGSVYSPAGSQLFELQPPSTPGGAWTTTYLHNFTNGQSTGGPLVIDQGGTLYGTTAAGLGQPASGNIYSIAPK